MGIPRVSAPLIGTPVLITLLPVLATLPVGATGSTTAAGTTVPLVCLCYTGKQGQHYYGGT
jgi:hypothetical protein